MKKILLTSIIFIVLSAIYIIFDYINSNSYTNNNTTKLIEIISKQNEPTIGRIYLTETTSNDVPCFEVINKTTGKKISPAKWMIKHGYQGYVIQKKGNGENIEIDVKNDKCKIYISLRGRHEYKDKKNNEKGLIPHWVKYTEFSINGENIIEQPVTVWHNAPYRHIITANKGNYFEVSIKWQKGEAPEITDKGK